MYSVPTSPSRRATRGGSPRGPAPPLPACPAYRPRQDPLAAPLAAGPATLPCLLPFRSLRRRSARPRADTALTVPRRFKPHEPTGALGPASSPPIGLYCERLHVYILIGSSSLGPPLRREEARDLGLRLGSARIPRRPSANVERLLSVPADPTQRGGLSSLRYGRGT